jgi:hypothetical protein
MAVTARRLALSPELTWRRPEARFRRGGERDRRWPSPEPLPREGDFCAPSRGFLWSQAGGFVDLDSLDPVAINNAGRILGRCPDNRTCLRTESGIRYLPRGFHGTDLTERSVVVGSYRGGAAVWAFNPGVRELDPDALSGYVSRMNESHVAVGEQRHASGSPVATMWTLFGAVSAPNAGAYLVARGISDRGWVVGAIGAAPTVWRVDRGATSLPIPATSNGGHGVEVNNTGQIAGEVTTEFSQQRAVLWIVR